MTVMIDTLPDSLVYLILQELNGICLGRIAKVSKNMSNFANNDELWEFVCGFCKRSAIYRLYTSVNYSAQLYRLQVPLKLQNLAGDTIDILRKAKEENYRLKRYKMYDNLTTYEQELATAEKKELYLEKTFRAYERAIADWEGIEYIPIRIFYRN
jgi:hypothetical protein